MGGTNFHLHRLKERGRKKKMQCCEERGVVVLVRLFYNVSSSFLLLFILFYFTFNLLAKILHYCGSPILQRSQDGYECLSSDEEEEETKPNNIYFHSEYAENDHFVADIIYENEALQFMHTKDVQNYEPTSYDDDPEEEAFVSPASEPEILEEDEDDQNTTLPRFNVDNNIGETITRSFTMDQGKHAHATKNENHDAQRIGKNEKYPENMHSNVLRDENFSIFAPTKSESKKFKVLGKNIIEDEIYYGDSCTIGSTSKDSSEWRSSIHCRDSCTEDPFSSSSRRSCPKWESYTVFQKYDEDMLFLDRISVQKLQETESLRSIQACPRSISERIVHKLSTKRRSTSWQSPYHELEAAYVAQICLTWEALNWNYTYFQRLRASRRESDPGCPAYVAQHFQQFQVLLQRYVENEPYEYGKRPEIYAKMRSVAPKLLQVPEYRDSNDEEKEGLGSRIPSNSFLLIMEESIRTFMNFLRADKESHCQKLAGFFKRNRRSVVDPTRLLLLKKINKKKKLKLKDLRQTRKCIRKRRLKPEEKMEILMALIDIKVVARVLRMFELNDEQLSWCDNKMSKVRVGDGTLQRESSPLFFPAH